jgi:hypothetical protein
MTIGELNDLIVRGAAQPGIREVEEVMRLSAALDQQARELAALYVVESIATVASGTTVIARYGNARQIGRCRCCRLWARCSIRTRRGLCPRGE